MRVRDDMLRESRIFEQERLEYQKNVDYAGIYPLGTFLPNEKHKLNQALVQMVPTSNTVLMYNTLRKNFGYVPFETNYFDDQTIYTLSGISAKETVKRFYGVDAQITNMTGEFLDTAGIHMPHHTIQLVELTNDNKVFYYVLTGGKGSIEAKADELFNANKMLQEGLPFRIENKSFAIDQMSIVELAIVMANDTFDKAWTTNHPLHAHELYAVMSDQVIDMVESTKWHPLKSFDNWTDAKRLGIVLRIKVL